MPGLFVDTQTHKTLTHQTNHNPMNIIPIKTRMMPLLPHPCLPEPHRISRQTLLLVPLFGLILACASCGDSSAPKPAPPPPPVTDTKPVGEGLKVIGYAMLGAAVVAVLGKLLR